MRGIVRVREALPPWGGGGACGVCAGGAERPPGDLVGNKELTGSFDKYRVVAWSDYERLCMFGSSVSCCWY